MGDLVDILSSIETGAESMLPPPKSFKASEFIETYAFHMDANHLQEKEERPEGERVQVIENRPPLDRSAFYMDTRIESLRRPASELMVYAVSTASMARQLEARGYTRIGGCWLGTGSKLPDRIEEAGGVGSSGASTREEAQPRVKLTCKYPTCKRGSDAPTPAAQIVEWFEGKVEIDGSLCAPLYKWTKEERDRQWGGASKQERATVANQLNSLAHMYLYVIQHMKEVGGAASDMEEGFDKLRSATRAALKKEGGKGRAEDSWWTKAERLAKARVEEPLPADEGQGGHE